MNIAIAGETLGGVKSLEEIADIFASVDVHAIELWPENIPVRPGQQLLHKRLYQNRDIGKAIRILDEKNVAVPCIAYSAGFDKELVDNTGLFSSQFKLAIETAHELGAHLVNHYCYYVAMDENPSIDHLLRHYAPAIESAEKLGITITLENEAHDATRSPEGMRRIIESIGSECFRTNFDATNYYQSGNEAFPYAYDMLKDCIAYVHIKNGCIHHPESGHNPDCRGGHMTGTLEGNHIYYPVASAGAVNIDGLLQRLRADGYDGWYTLEPHTTPEIALEYYREETAFLRTRCIFPNYPE